jgi:regulator of sigma E protease
MKYGVTVDALGASMGLQNGDQIIAVGSKKMEKYDPGFVMKEVLINMATTLKVKRNGEEVIIRIPEKAASELATTKKPFFTPRIPLVVAEAREGMPASKAGLQKNDSIIACNGKPMPYFDQFQSEVASNKGKEITVTFIRNQETREIKVTPTKEGLIGIAPYDFDRYYDLKTKSYSLLACFPAGVAKGWNALYVNIKALGQLVTGSGRVKASESLGGFISISKLFPTTWEWERFWAITAFLSLLLGFMNLLPIPALDGGHAVFLLIEIIIRRPVPQKVLEYAQLVGFILLLTLLVFANGMDIFRWFKG